MTFNTFTMGIGTTIITSISPHTQNLYFLSRCSKLEIIYYHSYAAAAKGVIALFFYGSPAMGIHVTSKNATYDLILRIIGVE
jgi:hypothetical protein